MKKKILLSDFLNPNKEIAINCQTEEDAKEFLRILDERGVKWGNGDSLSDTCYGCYNDLMCYSLVCNGLCYSTSEHFFNDGYTVYRYSDVEFVDDEESHEEQTADLKDEALCNIVGAMAAISGKLKGGCERDLHRLYAEAMKLLAEAFEIVCRS